MLQDFIKILKTSKCVDAFTYAPSEIVNLSLILCE